MKEDRECDTFVVVRNSEEQHAIWPATIPVPAGWDLAGQEGPKQACLDYVRSVWRDMRPRSARLRRPRTASPQDFTPVISPVDNLCQGIHSVEVCEARALEVLDQCGLGEFRLRLPQTRGGTELSILLRCGDEPPQGPDLHLTGNIALDGTVLGCVIQVDRETLRGTARFKGQFVQSEPDIVECQQV